METYDDVINAHDRDAFASDSIHCSIQFLIPPLGWFAFGLGNNKLNNG